MIYGHEEFKKTLPAAQKELQDIIKSMDEVSRLVREHGLSVHLVENKYTMIDYTVGLLVSINLKKDIYFLFSHYFGFCF